MTKEPSTRRGRHHQWGHDKRTEALPMVPKPATDRQIAWARLAIICTIVAWTAYAITWIFDDVLDATYKGAVGLTEAVVYLVIVTLLTTSTLAYLLSRLGYLYRSRSHHRPSRAVLDDFTDVATPTLTAIVPSYQEDARVIRNTLLSAALQEYPDKRVVLLIDDPPGPTSRRSRELLAAARALPRELQELLDEPSRRFDKALANFERALGVGEKLRPAGVAELAGHYEAARDWLEDLAATEDVIDHTDAFFANEVLRRLANDLDVVAEALYQAAESGSSLSPRRARQLYRRLAWTFRVELASFERKRYASLSHEPNKAMNLNSYIGLMGGNYKEVQTVAGTALVPAGLGAADYSVPNPDYVLTLDADSVLLPEYCLRLVHVLEQQEHSNVAIAQTPYSSFPGSSTRLERIAGATTDLQHIVHQGLTYFDATFWVGANAVIRKSALDDIAETYYIGDWQVHRYIKDRTVIEDTESTIDLGIHRWKLFNCPERLSYSATPPDFGSLCIQRRRWANGGLLILSKLHRQSKLRRREGERMRFAEVFLRWNYMASITWSSLSLLVLLAFPFNATLISPLLGLVALPYFAAMAADLRSCGYKVTDVARIYGFNLVLLPVNLAGSTSSVVQGITASRAAFARTPKIRDRTVVPALFLFAPYVLTGLAAYTFVYSYQLGRRENMAYAALNTVLLVYAIVAFIGPGHSVVDAWAHIKSLLYKPSEPKRKLRRREVPAPAAGLDWRSVLQLGAGEPVNLPSSARLALPIGPGEIHRSRRLPEADELRIVHQPVVEIEGRTVVGYEALTRFADGVSAERRLADAIAAGIGTELQAMLVRAALASAGAIQEGGAWLAVKASPQLIRVEPELLAEMASVGRPMVLEVTEPSTSDLPPELRRLPAMLPANTTLAIEHARLGHKSLTTLSELKPGYLKLDIAYCGADLASDRARQAQLTSLVDLAAEVGCQVIAMGVESEEQCRALASLGAQLGQGYLLGRPKELVNY